MTTKKMMIAQTVVMVFIAVSSRVIKATSELGM
jgi:hypothetical protein